MPDYTIVSSPTWSNDDDSTSVINDDPNATGFRLAQGFTTRSNVWVTSIEIRVGIEGPSGTGPERHEDDGLRMFLHEGGDSPGESELLGSSLFVPATDLPRYRTPSPGQSQLEAWSWVSFSFSRVAWSTGQRLWWVLRRQLTDSSDRIHVHRFWDPSHPYPDGSAWSYSGVLDQWVNLSSGQNNFAFRPTTGEGLANVDVHVTLSFEGLRLKGYCAAHPCPSEEGPSEVVLNCSGGFNPENPEVVANE